MSITQNSFLPHSYSIQYIKMSGWTTNNLLLTILDFCFLFLRVCVCACCFSFVLDFFFKFTFILLGFFFLLNYLLFKIWDFLLRFLFCFCSVFWVFFTFTFLFFLESTLRLETPYLMFLYKRLIHFVYIRFLLLPESGYLSKDLLKEVSALQSKKLKKKKKLFCSSFANYSFGSGIPTFM